METTKECGELDPQKGPEVKFARFVNGELILFSAYTTELEYIAVSHVFGKTEWFTIPGIKDEVLASTQKAAFIEKELSALIGDRAFWMDILTVNQRIQAEVVSVVGAIPWIFRNAVQTLAIREDDGIYSCCKKVLERVHDWKSHCSAFADHSFEHIDDMCEESYLQRLWTFQECLLSHSIRFVVCHRENHPKKKEVECGRLTKQASDMERLLHSLYVLWHCFRSSAKTEVSLDDFATAYVHGKTITRSKPRPRTVAEDIHTGSFYHANLVSQRAASEPRDYIYATMPPFPWYKYPANAENVAFGELFVDLYNQAAENRHTFAPKITASMTQSSATDMSKAWLPSKQQPEPECLGDFLKLLGRRLATDTPNSTSSFHVTTGVRVLPIVAEGPSKEFTTIPAEMESTFRSKTVDHHVDYVPILEYSRSILDAAWRAWSSHENALIENFFEKFFEKFLHEIESRRSKPLLYTTKLLVAMVNCQIGLSAARWVHKYFVPALIHYDDDNKVLGLLAKHSCPSGNLAPKQMMSVGRHLQGPSIGRDLVLVDFAVPSAPIGIIPDFGLSDQMDEEFVKRMQVLYRGLGEFVAPGKSEINFMSPETYAATMQERMQEHGE